MEKHIETFINKLSFTSIIIATLALLFLYFLQTPTTSLNYQKFPRSTCNLTHHRPFSTLTKKNHRIWATKSWTKSVQSYKAQFKSLQKAHNLFTNNSKILVISAGSGQPVMALTQMGVRDVTGVEVVESVPLVGRADPHNLPFLNGVFDFGFGPLFERALFPARYVREMERVVKSGGACVVDVEECGGDDVEEVVKLFRKSRMVDVKNVSFGGGEKRTCIVMKVVK